MAFEGGFLGMGKKKDEKPEPTPIPHGEYGHPSPNGPDREGK